jgi:hypothetical protein
MDSKIENGHLLPPNKYFKTSVLIAKAPQQPKDVELSLM